MMSVLVVNEHVIDLCVSGMLCQTPGLLRLVGNDDCTIIGREMLRVNMLAFNRRHTDGKLSGAEIKQALDDYEWSLHTNIPHEIREHQITTALQCLRYQISNLLHEVTPKDAEGRRVWHPLSDALNEFLEQRETVPEKAKKAVVWNYYDTEAL